MRPFSKRVFGVIAAAVALLRRLARRVCPQPHPSGPAALQGIGLRSLGPALATGRIQDVVIDPRNPSVWYVATAFGGLWKTINRGITFTPVFDDQGSFTLCCVAVDPNDSNIVLGRLRREYEPEQRTSATASTSRPTRRNWKRVGLATSEHIGRILIDPRNSNTLYGGARGLSGQPERGAGALQDDRRRYHLDRSADDQSGHEGSATSLFHPKNADTPLRHRLISAVEP